MKEMTSIWFIQKAHINLVSVVYSSYTVENPVHTLSFSSRLYPRQVHNHVTSDFDVCEVDPDTEMNFLNAALLVQNNIRQFLRQSLRHCSLHTPLAYV